MKSILTIAVVASIAMFSFGCGSGSTTATTVNNTNTSINSNSNAKPANTITTSTTANTTSAAPSNTETAKTQPAAAADDTIGVPECDDYIKKYDACLAKIAVKSPKAAATMKAAFVNFTDRWKKDANAPEGKSSVANACKAALEEARSNPALSTYACAW